MLTRSAWIDGLGMAVKTATLIRANLAAGKPMVNGGVCLYSDEDGTLSAIVDFHLVTKWKTAGDSLLAATRLAPPQVSEVLIVGSGTVANEDTSLGASCFAEQRTVETLRDGKPHYLADTPRFIKYARSTASRYRQLGPLMVLLDEIEGNETRVGYTF